MLENNIVKINANENTKNILYSLGYLREEAKRSGSVELYEIMKAAYLLGETAYLLGQKTTGDDEALGEYDDDTLKAAQFIFNFLKAPLNTQKETLSILEKNEIEQNIREKYN